MWISWRELEERVGLNDLPTFHRAFLAWRGVQGGQDMPLRRVQQRVEAELNRLVVSGQARREGSDWHVNPEVLRDFGVASAYLS